MHGLRLLMRRGLKPRPVRDRSSEPPTLRTTTAPHRANGCGVVLFSELEIGRDLAFLAPLCSRLARNDPPIADPHEPWTPTAPPLRVEEARGNVVSSAKLLDAISVAIVHDRLRLVVNGSDLEQRLGSESTDSFGKRCGNAPTKPRLCQPLRRGRVSRPTLIAAAVSSIRATRSLATDSVSDSEGAGQRKRNASSIPRGTEVDPLLQSKNHRLALPAAKSSAVRLLISSSSHRSIWRLSILAERSTANPAAIIPRMASLKSLAAGGGNKSSTRARLACGNFAASKNCTSVSTVAPFLRRGGPVTVLKSAEVGPAACGSPVSKGFHPLHIPEILGLRRPRLGVNNSKRKPRGIIGPLAFASHIGHPGVVEMMDARIRVRLPCAAG